MKKIIHLMAALLIATAGLSAQEKIDQAYYLPAVAYDPAVPSPKAWLGYEVGEWHVSHDQIVGYMRELARTSQRVQLREYGRSHEQRPMLCLTITAPENKPKLDGWKKQRQAMRQSPNAAADLSAMPSVAYMGYSIHGNEASGSNAAMLFAYYLAAGQSPELLDALRQTVILLDPCFNPDGVQRFAGWVNSRRSTAYVPDPQHDEFNETWPGGRFNHYWFDLNRDWLVTQQPESKGRVEIFQEWLPNVLTDHHEMGSNATFFFQPGVPTRVNPITPAKNQEMTAKIGQFHANALSEKKVLFYSGENYDDFYYGKGSTYPDANGSVGILFEQGSSRGSAQMTDNGLLSFPYSVRNQVITSFSTFKALTSMRGELNDYLREFYRSAAEEAQRDPVKGYVFGDLVQDETATKELLSILQRHQITVLQPQEDVTVGGKIFKKQHALYVPSNQPQYRLIRGIFDRMLTFKDSIFYDISAWTLPDAFGLEWAAVRTAVEGSAFQPAPPLARAAATTAPYAYVVEPNGYYLPRLLAALQAQGARVKVATKPFEVEGQKIAAGALLVPLDRQADKNTAITALLQESGCAYHAFGNGLTPTGPDLGSSSFAPVRVPKVVLLTGRGVNPLDAGEIWHLLDTRYGMPPVLMDVARFSTADLSPYNVIVMADGAFNNLSNDKLRNFISDGGTVVATGASLQWLKTAGLMSLEFRNPPGVPDRVRRPYGGLTEDVGARNLPGAIFEAELDLTHPVCYGYRRSRIPVFLGDTIFVETAQNPYATPVIFTRDPLLAGYIHPKQKSLVGGAAGVVVGGMGKGKIICFAGNPNFRSFWYGTNRLFANAVFFGNLISAEATEKKR